MIWLRSAYPSRSYRASMMNLSSANTPNISPGAFQTQTISICLVSVTSHRCKDLSNSTPQCLGFSAKSYPGEKINVDSWDNKRYSVHRSVETQSVRHTVDKVRRSSRRYCADELPVPCARTDLVACLVGRSLRLIL